MEEHEVVEVVIDTQEIADFLYGALLDFGLVPTETEVELIADLMFDFLLSKDVIEEEDCEEYDEDE